MNRQVHTPRQDAPDDRHLMGGQRLAEDGTETKLKNALCNATITLSAARSAIKNNWTTALQVTGIGWPTRRC